MGLGLRAASQGLRVVMFQFLKKRGSAIENHINLKNFKVICFDQVHPMFTCRKSRKGEESKGGMSVSKDFNKANHEILSGRYDLVIMDEVVNCVSGDFLDERLVIELIAAKPRSGELVLTGRGMTSGLRRAADYVTIMKKDKHPFDKGVCARRGIEY